MWTPHCYSFFMWTHCGIMRVMICTVASQQESSGFKPACSLGVFVMLTLKKCWFIIWVVLKNKNSISSQAVFFPFALQGTLVSLISLQYTWRCPAVHLCSDSIQLTVLWKRTFSQDFVQSHENLSTPLLLP